MSLVGEEPIACPEPDYLPIERDVEIALLEEALATNSELSQSDSRYGILTIGGNSPYANVARALECAVFDHYFDNGPEVMKAEYAPYEAASTFLLLVDRQRMMPAGVMRVIDTNENGFKSLVDLPTEKCRDTSGAPATDMSVDELCASLNLQPATTVDVATIAAHPEYGVKTTNDAIVLASLFHALHRYTTAHQIQDIVAIIDKVPLQKLQAVGLPTELPPGIAVPFEYLGAKGNSFVRIPVGQVDAAVSAHSQQVFDFIFGDNALAGMAQLSLREQ